MLLQILLIVFNAPPLPLEYKKFTFFIMGMNIFDVT